MAEKKKVRRRTRVNPVKLVCYFCKEKKSPVYSDVSTLLKYINERGRILSRSRNGNCAKHQRRISEAIKHARILALLPFTGRE